MRRFLVLLVLFLPASARAQANATVHLTLALRPDTNGRTQQPVLTTEDLLADPRVASMMASGFPLRLHYRLQVWRSRSLLDAQVRQTEWDVVIRHEPLLDQYQMAEVFRLTTRTSRFAGRDALGRGIATPREIRVAPTDAGAYYYIAAVDVSTLSDNDLKELERFISGDVGPAATGGEPVGGAISNAIKHLLVSVAAAPSIRTEARSEKFTVQ